MSGQMYIEGVLYDFRHAGMRAQHFTKYAVCLHCKEVWEHHVDLKCPFASTTFEYTGKYKVPEHALVP